MSRLALRILAAAAAAALALPRCRGLAFAPYSALGPVMIGQGREVAEGEAYAVNVVASACDCRIACWSNRRCVSASAVEAEDNSTLCRLSTKGPFDSTLVVNPNATYIFWNEDARILEDDLVYTSFKGLRTFSEAVDVCSRLPGHRVPIFKTKKNRRAMDQLHRMDTSRGFWVDLRRTETGYVWADGTRFQDTAVEGTVEFVPRSQEKTRHVFHFVNLWEHPTTGFYDRVVCQANPFGVEW